jgi:hypothetical protein
MSDLIFDVPWWMPTFLALLGIVIFWNGNSRQKPNLRNAGTGLVLFAIAWFTVSYLVETDREKVQKWTEQLIVGVAKGEWDAFRSKLAPEVVFKVQEGNHSYAEGRDKVAAFAKLGATAVKLDSAYVQSIHATQTGTIITVTANIYSNHSAANYPPTMNSAFQFDWELLSQGWAIREIRVTQIGNVKAGEIENFMGGVK